MRRQRFLGGLITAPTALLLACGDEDARQAPPAAVLAEQTLQDPDREGGRALAAVVAQRRSVRAYADRELTAAEVGQLLWSAQGVTGEGGKRAAPSAGGLYPLQLSVVERGGVHRYEPDRHRLATVARDDRRAALARACQGQEAVAGAPLVVVIAAVRARTAARYGDRADRYVALEAGHAAHGLLLAAVALGLAGVPIGSFDDDMVAEVVDLPGDAAPLYVVPIGQGV